MSYYDDFSFYMYLTVVFIEYYEIDLFDCWTNKSFAPADI